MTGEQAKQYEICKTRRHEETEPDQRSYYNIHQGQAALSQAMQAPSPWKKCRWCGTEYREVQETRQVERAI